MSFAPGRKFGNRPGVSLSRIRVANVGGEELDESFGRVGRRCEESRECSGAGYGELYSLFHGSFPLDYSV